MSNQKYILNKSKYVLCSLIGILVVILGFCWSFLLGGGRLIQLVHLGEIIGILTVTLGALIFAYRTAAFKPWLTAFGIGVPQEEEIIKAYIRICDTTVRILLFAGVMLFFSGVCNAVISIGDDILVFKLKLQSALTAPVLSLLTICALVLPTRAKLAFLLDEQSLKEAQLREKQRHIDNLSKG